MSDQMAGSLRHNKQDKFANYFKDQWNRSPYLGSWGGCKVPLVPRLSKQTDRIGGDCVQSHFGANAEQAVLQTGKTTAPLAPL